MEETTAEGPATHPFDVDTAVGDVHAGACSARISDRWHTFNGTPNGGYLLAVCLRALQQLTDREPLIVTGTFLRPGESGPACRSSSSGSGSANRGGPTC